ncbi:Lipid A core-O-antigen ligase and related enzymes [Mycobacteroides abscessus subsp. abscessus]|nr:Lipid A core-O-antigen ligase and related enzymes [Mycobacteroides abscessus subsp. abscessus]
MHWFVFVVLSLIFIVSPYSKGLYFITNFYGISIIIGFLLLVVIARFFLYKEKWDLKRMGIVFLLPLCYLYSLPGAASTQEATDLLIRWTTYASFFVLLYWSTEKSSIHKLMPIIFQATGIWISFNMLLVYSGIIHYKGILVSGRFAGVFQYPNTFAMVMGVFILFSLIMLTRSELDLKYILLYSLPLVPYIICFIQAYSRGMLLVLPLVWLVGLLLISVKKQVEYMTYSLIGFGLGLVLYQFISSSNKTYFILLAIMSVVFSTCIFVLKKIGFNRFFSIVKIKSLLSKKYTQLVLPLCIILVGLAGILDIQNHGLLYKSIPGDLQQRIDSISLNAGTAKERYVFAEDALQFSNEAPLLGSGGGSWKVVFKEYQQNPYSSSRIHNGYLEWLVDTGWIGIILFILVFAYYLQKVFRSLLQTEENQLQVASFAGLVIIFMHSAIDFNFSFGTVWFIVFWLLMSAIPRESGESFVRQPNKAFLNLYPKIMVGIISVLIIVNLTFTFSNMQAARLFNQSKESNSYLEKIKYLEEAVDMAPKNTKYISALLDLKMQVAEKDKDFKRARELVTMLTETEPRNSTMVFKGALIAEEIGENELAFSLYERALRLDHFNTKLYEASMRYKSRMALNSEINREFYATSMLQDFNTAKKWDSFVRNKGISEEFNSRRYHITGNMQYREALAYLMLKNYDQVIKLYRDNESTDYRLEAISMVAYEQLGFNEKVEEISVASSDKENVEKLYVQLNGIFTN